VKLLGKDIQSFSDEELMQQLSTRKKNAALTELHARYAKRILGFFIRMFKGDVQKAQDFTQDVFLRILERHIQFDPSKRFYTWMYVIAVNMCKTEFRKPNTDEFSDELKPISAVNWDEITLDKELFHHALKQAIEALEEHHQLAFVLRFMQELSVKEIALITEVSEGTVKSRLHHATKKVTAKLTVFNPNEDQNVFKIV
jgi:RNA polymerase sigma-70 factor, ECF subfamily